MKLPNTMRRIERNGTTYVLRRAAVSGKFSVPANEPPASDPKPDVDSGGDGDKTGDDGKKYTDAEVNRIAAKHKSEGKLAAEKAMADSLGVSVEDAKKIIAKHQETEDATKSEAERERAAAVKEREAAEAAKREATAEQHEARIERALTKEGFDGDDKKLARVRRMITVEVGATYEDVLADVQEAKTDFPELFASKAPEDKDGKPGTRKLPSSDPSGKPPKPSGGEDAYAAGQKRFEDEAQKRRGYNPLAKTST
jgi:multidrug efflux pump subunit AcrA (membrane-fusion protein)